MKFRDWLLSESHSPRILLPYIKHRMEKRLSGIQSEQLRQDYEYAMGMMEKILGGKDSLTVMHRRALRVFEINRDHMSQRAQVDEGYGRELSRTHADEDVWNFVGALEDLLNGKTPKLESFL
jgi:hypothetical protein